MATQPGSREERHETIRLCGTGVEHLPDINIEAATNLLKLIDQRDIDHSKDILKQLGHLRGPESGDWDDTLHDRFVECNHEIQARRRQPRHHFRCVRKSPGMVAWIDSLR